MQIIIKYNTLYKISSTDNNNTGSNPIRSELGKNVWGCDGKIMKNYGQRQSFQNTMIDYVLNRS